MLEERPFKDISTEILKAKLRRKSCSMREEITYELRLRAEEWADDVIKNVKFE